MYTSCDELFKFTIPAVRVAAARELNSKYHVGQADIARELGIAQAAVSKYLSGRYSVKVRKLASIIEASNLHAPVVKAAAAEAKGASVAAKIDEVASSAPVVKAAMKLI